jgi:hypothetical protein
MFIIRFSELKTICSPNNINLNEQWQSHVTWFNVKELRLVVSIMSRSLYSRERPCTHWIGCSLDTRAVDKATTMSTQGIKIRFHCYWAHTRSLVTNWLNYPSILAFWPVLSVWTILFLLLHSVIYFPRLGLSIFIYLSVYKRTLK